VKYRNWVIAHEYKIGAAPEFIPPWRVLATRTVPVGAAEWILLLECVRQAVACVLAYYGDIYRGLAPVLDPGDEPVVDKGVKDGAEAQAERVRMARDANGRLKALGVDLGDPVFTQFKCRTLSEVTA
jgi:hypothetical protein